MKSSGKCAQHTSMRNLDLGPAAVPLGGGRPAFDPSRRRAIIIGIDRYDDQRIGNLKNCISDVESMKRVVTDPEIGMFSPEHVTVLRSDASNRRDLPTKENIRLAIEEIGDEAETVDEVWFYFAGHGYADPADRTHDGYLVPMDARFEENRNRPNTDSLISTQYMHDHWFRNALPLQTIVMFLDCCCAGSMGWNGRENRGIGAAEMHRNAFQENRCRQGLEDRGYFCFQAADRYQDARDGNYTKHLVRALKGEPTGVGRVRSSRRDGTVTVATVSAFLGDTVVGQDPRNRADGFVNHVLSYDPVRLHELENRRRGMDSILTWIHGLEMSHQFDEQADFNAWREALERGDSLLADALFFFGNSPAGEPRTMPDNADETAVRILSALVMAEATPIAEPVPNVQSPPPVSPAALPPRTLSVAERQRLLDIANGIRQQGGRWTNRDFSARWEALSTAETEETALVAIHAVESMLNDEFMGQNPDPVERLQRLDPFLPYGFRLDFPSPTSSVDSALQNLLRLVRTLCR